MSNQFEQDPSNFTDTSLHSVWARRTLDLPLPEVDLTRPITQEDLAFLKSRSMYIQVINSQAVLSGMAGPELVNIEGNWTIHDYGEAMSVSPGTHLFAYTANDTLSSDEQGKTGTLTKQAFDVAKEMIALAIKKGWKGIEVIAGERLMQWAIWMAAEDQQFKVFGYEPNAEEKIRRARVLKLKEKPKTKKE